MYLGRLDETEGAITIHGQGSYISDPGSHVSVIYSSRPVIAWRVWRVTVWAGTPRLSHAGAGKAFSSEWTPARAPAARCVRTLFGESMHGPAPVATCECGYYAWSMSTLESGHPDPLTIGASAVGTVVMWGRVIEHSLGFRAQHAYPLSLALICAICSLPQVVSCRVLADRSLDTRCESHARRTSLGQVVPPAIVTAMLRSEYMEWQRPDAEPGPASHIKSEPPRLMVH